MRRDRSFAQLCTRQYVHSLQHLRVRLQTRIQGSTLMFASSCRTLAAAMKASPMPVLPEVGSTSVVLPVRMQLVNTGLVCNQRRAAVWQPVSISGIPLEAAMEADASTAKVHPFRLRSVGKHPATSLSQRTTSASSRAAHLAG